MTINGTQYTVAAKTDETENQYTQNDIKALISDGDTVVIATKTYVAMTDADNNGIGDNDASVIAAAKAYALIKDELAKASSVGVDPGQEATVTGGTAANGKVTYTITEGKVETTQGLQVGLHVGADADETNKIAFTINTMDSAGLGVKGINIVDNTGAKATYAIDAIADAVAKVSEQRSALGAVQNRLEHTIANLDNVVENTTSAESQIRDTDMAEEMVNYSKNNILAQAGQSMLAQANQSTQGVLSLLG